MTKNLWIIAIITIAIIVGGTFLLTKNNSASNPDATINPATITYFWGEGCPHCEIVAKFMETWEKKDSIKIDKLESFENKDNGKKLIDTGKNICKYPIPTKDNNSPLGSVPLMVTPDGKCLLGDEPIIEYLKTL